MYFNVLNINKKFFFCKYSKFFFILNNILKIFNKKINLNINFVKKNEIIKLNLNYRGYNNVTDILTFKYKLISVENYFFADIFIYEELLYFKAIFYAISIENMFFILFIHGILHILDFDHKKNIQFLKMRKIENLLLSKNHF